MIPLILIVIVLRNAIEPLMLLLRPHDADTNEVASRDSNTNTSGIM